MRIFKHWFFYLFIAGVVLILAVLSAADYKQYNQNGEKNDIWGNAKKAGWEIYNNWGKKDDVKKGAEVLATSSQKTAIKQLEQEGPKAIKLVFTAIMAKFSAKDGGINVFSSYIKENKGKLNLADVNFDYEAKNLKNNIDKISQEVDAK